MRELLVESLIFTWCVGLSGPIPPLIDENVELAELLNDLLDDSVDGGLVADIESPEGRYPGTVRDRLRAPLACRVIDVDHGDGNTFAVKVSAVERLMPMRQP